MNNIIQTIRHTARAALTLLIMLLTATTAGAADITQNTAVVINSGNKAQYNNKSIAGNVPGTSYAGNIDTFISRGAIVVDGIELNLTIDGLNVDYSEQTTPLSGISLVNGAKLHLTVNGTNTLKAGYGGAGIAVPFGCSLEITAASTGTLNATGGNSFGGGAGIGSRGNGANTNQTNNQIYPQGCGDITINGGTVNAQGGTWYYYYDANGGAAGIGSSECSGWTVSGVTFGDNTYVNNVTGTITINGGTVHATGGFYAAGIGGGSTGTVKSITINGGNVTATAGDQAAAIGTGLNGSGGSKTKLTCPLITIGHGTVQANGSIGFGKALNAACNVGDSYTFIGDAIVTCTGSINVPKIPERNGNEEYFTIPEGIRTFKVYDPAGKDDVYSVFGSNQHSFLMLTAPTGYRLQLTGDVYLEDFTAHFEVFNGEPISSNRLIDIEGTTHKPVSVTSSGRHLCLYIDGSKSHRDYYDIELLVTVFKPGETKTVSIQQTAGGTVASDKTSAEFGETVTLTVTPNTGKFAEKVIYNDGADHIVTRSDDGKYRFAMPVYDVTAHAQFEDVNNLNFGTVTGLQSVYFYDGGNAINISYDVETVNGTVLSKGNDYEAVIRNSSNEVVASVTALGTYTLTVTGKGNYTGSLTKTFVVQEGLRGSGTSETPYLIGTTDEWNFFANTVNSGISSYTNQYVKLTNDIGNVTVAAGTSDHPFCGTFIGGGYTMGLKIRNGQVKGLAPFSHISGATIKELTVTGSVFGFTHSAGLVGFAHGTNTIDGCKVNVRVEANNVGNQHIGGVVGHGLNSTLTIKNTSFGGLLVNRGDYAGGLMGWCDAGCTLTIDNCLTTGTCETEGDKVFHPIAIRNENAAVTAIDRGAYYTSQPTQTESARILMRGTRVYADQPDNEMYQHQVLADGNSYYVPVTINGLEAVYTYTGTAINPTYSVTAGDGTTLTEGTDYSVTRSNATIRDAGAYAITFTGKNGYEGAKTCYFIVGDPTPATPGGLSVDADIDYPEAGHFYYNMPAGNPESNTLTFSNSDVTTFKVYDGGGKNGNIPLKITRSSLTITAPAGCTISVEGDVKLYDNNWYNYVSVYNVSGDGETELTKVQGYNTLGPVTSTSNTLRIYYYQGGPGAALFGNKPGYDLTVTINDANKKYAVNVVTPTNGSLSTSPTEAAPGSTVTITATPAEGYLNGEFTVLDYSQRPVAVSNGQFVMPSSPVIVATTFRQIDPADFSVNVDGSYTIHTAAGWDGFCDALHDNATYNRFSGKTVKLDADIEVNRMAGSSGHDFCGTFDGGGHTLTFNHGDTDNYANEEYIAPFHYVSTEGGKPAAIKNLHVKGDIYTSAKYAAGLIAQHWGRVNIENCRVSTVIHSSVSGDGTHGGFEAMNVGWLNITGCVFDGKLLSKNSGDDATINCGGFVGWHNSGITNISNSIYAPDTLGEGETEVGPGVGGQNPSATFGRNTVNSITNSYYTRTLGTVQSKYPHIVTAGENVTISNIALTGDATPYNVSGITAYSGGGLSYGGNIYYGWNDKVELTLSNSTTDLDGYKCDYKASAGALTGVENPYTLTMPDQDVIISATLYNLTLLGYNDNPLVDGSDEHPYVISTTDGLNYFCDLVNGGQTFGGKTVKLGADIAYNPANLTINNNSSAIYTSGGDDEDDSNYTAIGNADHPFCGHFDGQNHVVSGIRIKFSRTNPSTGNYQGLFGYISGAKVERVILADTQITGLTYCGSIVGYNYGGTIENCHALSDVTINDFRPDTNGHGGIVGWNYTGSTVTGCTSAASITIAPANSNSRLYYGGIAGDNRNKSTISDCLYLGNSNYEGKKYIGAITGNNLSSDLRNCYYTSTTITGKNDKEEVIANADCAAGFTNTELSDCGLAPQDNADNSAFLTLMAARNAALTAVERTTPLSTAIDLTLNGRKLWKDGDWNTLCLPFDVSITSGTLSGDNVVAMTLNSTASNLNDGTLTLNFDAVATTGEQAGLIPAGTPFIIKWASKESPATDLVNPVFSGVTIDNSAEAIARKTVTFGGVSFVGTYNPVIIPSGGDNTKLYLGANNTLYWPNDAMTIGAFRAYFQLTEDAQAFSRFVLNFGDEEVQGISLTPGPSPRGEGSIYTLDGVKLDKMPTRKGVYIMNGRKVVIK